jgi:AraC-like DNA-binding protein
VIEKAPNNAWPARRAFRQLSRGRDLLADVQDASIDLAAVAREAGMSRFHFIRRFEAMFGETPHQFRTRERLVVAQRLLARGHSVTDACFEVGFASVGSFSALFTRIVGMPPSHFQRQHRAFVVPDWAPHPPICLLWMGGPGAIAIFEKRLLPISAKLNPTE